MSEIAVIGAGAWGTALSIVALPLSTAAAQWHAIATHRYTRCVMPAWK